MIKIIKKPAKFNYFTYIGDYQGCGYIRVLIPSILVNQTRFDGYKVRSSYHDHFINDMGFYNKLSFVQFQRAYTNQHYKLIHHFNVNVSKMTKTPILYEIDDMLIGIPEWNYAADFYSKYEDNVKKILGIVRGVTCSTEKLKSIYSEYNNNITVIPNHLAKFLWGNIERKEQRDSKPRILYAGSQNHFCTEKLKKQGKSGGDFGPELIDFIRKTTDKYQWVFVGGNPMELDDLIDSGKIEYHGWQSIFSLPQFLKSLNVDIGLAPLMMNTFNEGKCLIANTLLITDKGIKSINNINIDDKVWQNDKFVHVNEKIKYDNLPTIKVITKKGYEIEGTYNHRIEQCNKFVRLDELSIGDIVTLGTYKFPDINYKIISCPFFLTKKLDSINLDDLDESVTANVTINERWGRFIGYVLGDGHLASSNSVAISCDKRHVDVIDDLKLFASQIGVNTFESAKKQKDKNITVNGVDIVFSSRNLKWILGEKIGFNGRYCKNLQVPKIILESPKSVIREFIRGLFEADGTVESKGVGCSFTSKDKKLVKEIQFLLLGFGIISKIKITFNKVYKKEYYTLKLGRQACDIFYREIGFISHIKNNKLKHIIEKKHGNSYKEWTFDDEIISITYDNNNVYDLQVDGSYYLANGIVSHNSNIKALEYAALGIPGVYTNIEPYKDMMFTCDTDVDMIDRIELLTSDIDMRNRVYDYDYDVVKEQLFWEDHDNIKKYINSYLSLFNKKMED